MVRAWVSAAFALLLLLVGGCGSTAGGTVASSGSAFNPTDVAWLQLAEALHARALPMLALAPGRSASPELVEVAERLAEEHGEGRERLRALLVRAGAGAVENPHAGHDMPGMPTADDLEALRGLRGKKFDRRFVPLVRAYLDQLVLVAEGERRSGASEEVRRLAATMARAHEAELARLAEAAPETSVR
ncbi:DUF305 domain-containing protein [Nonomuraea sp. LP-02]|uniref:DUF305 domain-containing protein n=1 Tax=Nonomuraea sp. LP-02 TaxID=3097960 RepID=UPI002E323C8E|nr:DUF305 domain-containing protein [Nonomuraea sp. LP-02]MED7929771.1 DUF305 domain-containing protein [Nonomuraea sp. LP-02]